MGIPVSIAASTIHTTPAPTAPASLWNPAYFKHLLVSGKCSVQMKTMKTGLYFVFLGCNGKKAAFLKYACSF